eukprot:scaffold385_cov305-Pinguiococcus_pyrenoidosus.AAC.14
MSSPREDQLISNQISSCSALTLPGGQSVCVVSDAGCGAESNAAPCSPGPRGPPSHHCAAFGGKEALARAAAKLRRRRGCSRSSRGPATDGPDHHFQRRGGDGELRRCDGRGPRPGGEDGVAPGRAGDGRAGPAQRRCVSLACFLALPGPGRDALTPWPLGPIPW